jgi:uncharacterized membrane protein
MNKNKTQPALVNIVLTALFAAVCYVALFFKFDIPSPVGNPFIHFGNLFVILAALLFSGKVGGIAGSLGMGLFDLTQGYAIYAPKTFVLKLGIGLVAGFVASKGKKPDAKSPVKWISAGAAVLIVFGLTMLFLAVGKGSEFKFEGLEKTFVISPVLYIFSLVLGGLLLAAAVFAKKLSVKLQFALIAAVSGIFFNLAGEFLLGALYFVILQGSAWPPALIASAISLPATIINGTFSVIGAVLLYIPLEKAVKSSGFLK